MRVRKTFKFEAAHRLLRCATERCQGIHGHSYKVEIILNGDAERILKSDSVSTGMVIDFGVIKSVVGSFIDKFDHSLVLSIHDPLVVKVDFPNANQDNFLQAYTIRDLHMLNPRWILVPYNPTAEMMAAHIFWYASRALAGKGPFYTEGVRVHETESGYAESSGGIGEIDWEQTIWSKALRGEEGSAEDGEATGGGCDGCSDCQ